MNFTKLQGLGNDFVLMDAMAMPERDWPAMATRVCERRFGVGSDGLLVLLDSNSADYRMRMFNPDGSEAEACGNGLRCLVCYLVEAGLAKGGPMRIETLSGIRSASTVTSRGGKLLIRVSMGKPAFSPESLPVKAAPGEGRLFDIMLGDYRLSAGGKELSLDFVSMGNPHAVFFTPESAGSFPLKDIGPLVEKSAIFPRGVNFEVARITGSAACEMRVWERGAGEALACGSGACAVAVAARMRGLATGDLEIKLPGGTAVVGWDGRGEVWLTGPAELVFTGEWPEK